MWCSKSKIGVNTQVIHGEYHPHIDGIRALAILPVLLFHILAKLCPGGFAGVDVFFVISGYLITGGILRELQKERFTIRNFYYRRIRRIMPAYFAMISGVFVIGCVVYYAAPLILLGDAVSAGTLFLANVHFWKMGGDYFSTALHSQALLHLWSLSVEEQFYLFIPLLCAVIWKIQRRVVVPVFTLLAVLSLVGAIYAVTTGKQSSAFYLLHFRAWELLAGSLLAMIPAPVHKDSHIAVQIWERPAFFAITGLLLVVFTYICISSKTPFPGAVAIIPVIGTVLLIRYGHGGWVGQILCWKPMVAIGKFSYSLYLWHWPVTVFWKYVTYERLSAYDYVGMLLLSLVLGYFSWRFIELPVRTSSTWTVRRAFVFSTVGIVCLVILGSICVGSKGWPELHPSANAVTNITEPRDPFVADRAIAIIRRIGSAIGVNFSLIEKHDRSMKLQYAVYRGQEGNKSATIGATGEPKIFILGDSHAGNLEYGLGAVLEEKGMAAYITSLGGAELFDMNKAPAQAALKRLQDFPRVETVILAQMWSAHTKSGDPGSEEVSQAMYRRLEEFVFHIKSMEKKIVILTDTPCYKHSPNDIIARTKIITPRDKNIEKEYRGQSDVEYTLSQGEINFRLEEVCRKTGAILIPLHMAFKAPGCYVAFEEAGLKDIPLYSDASHLSYAGSLRAAQFIMTHLSL